MNEFADCLISVALCTYNGVRYLREQLDSLLAQTYRNIEIVAVDDCSTDATIAILQEYAQRDQRLRTFVNPVNLGFKRNFECAMSMCRGKLIAPCDQDDIWLNDKLEKLLDAIGSHSMAYCDSSLIAEDGADLGLKLSDTLKMQHFSEPLPFVMDNCVSGHAMLFRRELIEQALPIPNGWFHDWWLAAVASTRDGVVFCPRALVRYRQHGETITDVLRQRFGHGDRPPGSGTKRYEETKQRLRSLAQLPGRSQNLFVLFLRLWEARSGEWLSFSLAHFIIKYRQRMFAMSKKSDLSLLRKASAYLIGLRFRRLVKRRKYASLRNAGAR
ncbi:MAG TPA: glycosyltransferase family 2 protein [Steroidobacteraceae bacterium]|nr:glycosyltransferase family 2 protein [Steroidobacteraceae bacterium]